MSVAPRDFMLTFDDGPLPGRTDAVLDALRGLMGEDGQPVRAGFFMVGDAPTGFWQGRRHYAPYEMWVRKGSMRRYPELVERVRAEGHWIGNHTARHIWPRWWWYRSEARLQAELADWERMASESAGFSFADQPRLFRTPYLADTPELKRVATGQGYHMVGGVTVGDASPDRDAAAITRRILRLFQSDKHGSGPIVLIFHDVFPVTFRHLAEIVVAVQKQGHRLRHFDTEALAA